MIPLGWMSQSIWQVESRSCPGMLTLGLGLWWGCPGPLDVPGTSALASGSLGGQGLGAGCISWGFASTGEKQHLQDCLMLHTVPFPDS